MSIGASDIAAHAESAACAVCKEDFVVGDAALRLPCAHLYHDDCIVQWLKNTGTCPICRKPVDDENNDN